MSQSKTLIVRYRTRPDTAEENSRPVEAVFASRAELEPSDYSSTTYQLDDGVSFVHVARIDGTQNPLATLPASHRKQIERTEMRAYEATLLIAAAPEQIWRVLTDTAAWPDWDSGVTKVDGRLALGETLRISIEANAGRAFPVKVVTLSEPERMVFRGGMPLGLFVGERTYTLKRNGSATRFTMREQYTGPLAGMIFRSIPDLGPSFRQFAEGLKRRTE